MAANPSNPGMGSMLRMKTAIWRKPKNPTAAARVGWAVASITS